MAPLPPPLPTTMARDLPHEPPPASSTAAPSRRTGSPQDACYIQGMIGELQTMFHRWQQLSSNTAEHRLLTKELLTSCYCIDWKVLDWEKSLSVAYYQLDEFELSRQREWILSARYKVAAIRRAVEREISKSAITHEDPMCTTRTIHHSAQDNNGYVSSESDIQQLLLRQRDDEHNEISASVQSIGGIGELSRQDSSLNQQGDHPCLPLDKKATIGAMRIISTSTLTVIAALSTYSSETVAPLARGRLAQEVLLISPYVCVTIALIGAALSFCASERNGLADCASIAVLVVFLFGIGLGASAVIIILHAAHRPTVLWTYALMVTFIFAWGWLFAYPRCLKFVMRMLYWECFDQRRSTNPRRAAHTHPTSQYTDQKGFRKMLSNSFAACRRAFIPLNEDTTIDIMKTVSPSLLTAISALSLWAAHTVAPQAYYSVALQRFLYMLPYFYLPLGVVAIALAVSASKSNGLASPASTLGLVLCACGVALGACCSIVLLHFRPLLSALVAAVLVGALIITWGWMLAYPKMLNFAIRKSCCLYCARQLRIVPSGRIDCCGRNSWAWLFVLLKILVRNMVLLPSNSFAICSRSARGWWNAGHIARGDLDLEAGAGGLELIPISVYPERRGRPSLRMESKMGLLVTPVVLGM